MNVFGTQLSGDWEKWRCPHCKNVNWVYLGRLDDITAIDYESCKCFSCKKVFWLGEVDENYDKTFRDGGLEESTCQDGKERPD